MRNVNTTRLGQGLGGWGVSNLERGRQSNRKGAQSSLLLHTWSTLRPLTQRYLEEDRTKYVISPPLFAKEGLPFLILVKYLIAISTPCVNTLPRPAR